MARINLKQAVTSASADASQRRVMVHIEDRLPRHVNGVRSVVCDYKVVQRGEWYELSMETSAAVEVCCLRCLDIFQYTYHSQQTIACCQNEATAHQLMKDYDSIVVLDGVVNLVDMITDDLHLSVPEMHAVEDECNKHLA